MVLVRTKCQNYLKSNTKRHEFEAIEINLDSPNHQDSICKIEFDIEVKGWYLKTRTHGTNRF